MPHNTKIFLLFLTSLFAPTFQALAQAPNPPQEKRADLSGRITAVSPDGKTLTLAIPPARSPEGQPPVRDAKPEQATVNITASTQLLFFGVGEGQAQPAPGQMAMVWLADGSKDQAARIRLMKREGEERPDVQGRVLAVSPDGRIVTIETRERDQVTGKVELRLAPYTQSLYYGVDKDGARPTVDYQVVAWLEKGSKDVPVRIRFMKSDPAEAAAPRRP